MKNSVKLIETMKSKYFKVAILLCLFLVLSGCKKYYYESYLSIFDYEASFSESVIPSTGDIGEEYIKNKLAIEDDVYIGFGLNYTKEYRETKKAKIDVLKEPYSFDGIEVGIKFNKDYGNPESIDITKADFTILNRDGTRYEYSVLEEKQYTGVLDRVVTPKYFPSRLAEWIDKKSRPKAGFVEIILSRELRDELSAIKAEYPAHVEIGKNIIRELLDREFLVQRYEGKDSEEDHFILNPYWLDKLDKLPSKIDFIDNEQAREYTISLLKSLRRFDIYTIIGSSSNPSPLLQEIAGNIRDDNIKKIIFHVEFTGVYEDGTRRDYVCKHIVYYSHVRRHPSLIWYM